MIDPVSGAAAAVPPSHLQLVETTPAAPGAKTSAPSDATASDKAGAANAQPSTRVYIDRGDAGVYVYRLVDAASGRVIAELPRAQSGSLKVLDGYEPGAVTSASA